MTRADPATGERTQRERSDEGPTAVQLPGSEPEGAASGSAWRVGSVAVGSNLETARPMIQTWGLGKRYGQVDALIDCSVRVNQGEIFGLLGPNGAGKTTLIRSWLGFLQPTSGRSEVDGLNPVVDSVAVRRRVAYLPGDARLPRHMNGRGVLRFFAELHPDGDLSRSLEVAERLELDLHRRVAFMSTGMRQKLALAVVFGPRTPVLILDEPTANLDPTIRAAVLDLVSEAQQQQRTVVFSSHVLSEIEQTCGRVAFLRQGRLVHQLVMADLFQRHRLTARTTVATINVPAAMRERISVRMLGPTGEAGTYRVQIDTAGDLAPFLAWIDSLSLAQLRIEPLGLHAIYQAVHFGEELTV